MGNKTSWRVRQHFIIILSSTILIITSFLVSKYQKLPTQTQDPTTNLPRDEVMRGWKIYRNNDLNIIFRYPPDLTVQESSIKTILNQPRVILRLIKINNSLDYPDIILTIAESDISIEEWIESQNYCPDWFKSCTPFISGPVPDPVQFKSINRHYSSIDTFFKQGNLIYDFGLGARNPNQPFDEEIKGIYNQILSSFKFLPDTSDWKTYTNEEDLYSIKYPGDKLVRIICPNKELVLEIRQPGETQDLLEVPTCGRGGRFALETAAYDTNKGEKPWTDYSGYEIIEKDIVVGGISTKLITYSSTDLEEPEEPMLNDWLSTVSISKGGRIYKITLGAPELSEIFNQILSTFQFIE